MARHHRYSKRSRESRKAKGHGVGDELDDAADGAVEDERTVADDPGRPSDPAS